jgi:hypothetical protein
MSLFLRIILSLSLLLFVSCSNETTFTPTAGSDGPVITNYSFGKMIVDGKTYTNELQILSNGTVKSWSPKDPHYILPSDIEEIVNSGIDTIIIGTGDVGNAGVPEETFNFLKSKNITVHELNTHKAMELFNNSKKDKLGAVFHLNC